VFFFGAPAPIAQLGSLVFVFVQSVRLAHRNQ
jgi:hypothetical protein